MYSKLAPRRRGNAITERNNPRYRFPRILTPDNGVHNTVWLLQPTACHVGYGLRYFDDLYGDKFGAHAVFGRHSCTFAFGRLHYSNPEIWHRFNFQLPPQTSFCWLCVSTEACRTKHSVRLVLTPESVPLNCMNRRLSCIYLPASATRRYRVRISDIGYGPQSGLYRMHTSGPRPH
jgi:hypothetical protein